MAITIKLEDRKIFTLKPNGTDLVQLQDPVEFNKNSIGERKRIELHFSTNISIIDSQIYFDPALYLPLGSPTPAPNIPTQYWGYYVQSGIIPGPAYMPLVLPPPYNSGLLKNWTATFVYIDTTNFKILFEYFQLYDLNSFLDVASEDNKFKLTKDIVTNPIEVSNTGNSIYNDASFAPQFYIYIDNNVDSGFLNITIDDYFAAFYNESATGGAPYFTLPVWGLKVNSLPVSTFSLDKDTKVTFGVSAPVIVDKIFIWLIKTSANNNNVDFISAYDASYLDVTTVAGSSTLHNKIKAPSTGPTLNVSKYEVSFTIDKTKLLYGEKYRMVAVVYESGYGGVEVTSFISNEYTIDQLPKFTGQGYVFKGLLEDYESTYTGNFLVCVVEERMKSRLVVDYSTYNIFSDDILNRLGLNVANNIKKYLTKVTVEVYENNGTYIQYLERLVATRTDPVNYNVPNGLELNFTSGELEVVYSFRNRYESGIANLETILIAGNVPILPPNSNQNWANRVLIIKYSLELFYDDYSTPFSDTIIFEQVLEPKGYGLEISIVEFPNKEIYSTSYFCSTTPSVCLEAKLSVSNPEDYDLIVTLEPDPGNSNTIEENEEWLGANSTLPQLQSAKILTSETFFSQTISGAAIFCIIPSKFLLNLPYKISAIAKLKTTSCSVFNMIWRDACSWNDSDIWVD